MSSRKFGSSASTIVSIIFLCIMLSCKEKPPVTRQKLTLVFVNIPSVIIDEAGNLTSDGQSLLSEIESTDPKCNHTYVLDPELTRPDIDLKHSAATVIEKSGILQTDKPEVIVKYLRRKLDTLVIPEALLKKPVSKSVADSSYFNYIQSVSLQRDSIIVFMTDKNNIPYEYNSKKYKTLFSIDDIRKQIQSILCSNSKATVALLIDPPIQVVKPNQTVHTGVTTSGPPNNPGRIRIQKPGNIAEARHHGASQAGPIGDLTILKGSEGCEICTRYYTAYDATGRRHEIKEQNSTNCCPCNKTIEIRGRTFVMNCDGSPRLQPVE